MRALFGLSRGILLTLVVSVALLRASQVVAAPHSVPTSDQSPTVYHLKIDQMILPGTAAYVSRGISLASKSGAQLVLIELNTPGGLLQSAQEIVQAIFSSLVPVAVYVSPSGGMAASAGVFITMAGHVAAMAPGTTIGAATPVSGDGKDIGADMKAKAESITAAMVRSIAEQRGRNIEWAEKAVREASSMTEREALKNSVIDLVAEDVNDLFRQISGKKMKVHNVELALGALADARLVSPPMGTREQAINLLANPTVAALLWLGATTGLSIELYNPGAILPGVVGVICLVLALIVNQIIPLNTGGVALIALGGLLIGAELLVPSGILAIGGLIAIVLGAIYLVDPGEMPGVMVNLNIFLPLAGTIGAATLWLIFLILRSRSKPVLTGKSGMVGAVGRALDNFTNQGQVSIGGEIWRACAKSGMVERDQQVRVLEVLDGLRLLVEPLDSSGNLRK